MPADQRLSPRIGNTILCEEIREELGRKHTFLGVFSGNVEVTAPGFVKLALYIEVWCDQAGEYKFQLDGRFAEEQIFSGELALQMTDVTIPGVFAFPSFPLMVPKSGLFEIDLIADGQRFPVLRKHIKVLSEAASDLREGPSA